MNSIKGHNTDFHKISFKKFTLKNRPLKKNYDMFPEQFSKIFQNRGTSEEMLCHPWMRKQLVSGRRLSKRSSSVALGVSDVNLNLSDCSSNGTDPRTSISILSSTDLEDLEEVKNPPKKPRHVCESWSSKPISRKVVNRRGIKFNYMIKFYIYE